MGCNSSVHVAEQTTIHKKNEDENRIDSATHKKNENENRIDSATHKNNRIQSAKSLKTSKELTSSTNEINEWIKLVDGLQNKTKLNNYVLSRERTSFNSLDELKIFLNEAPTENDVEKAWAIFMWITHNIDYDFDGAYRGGKMGSQDANSVFKSGLSVCAGYARITKELFDFMNIQCLVICGYAKGYSYKPGQKFKSTNHDWSAVYINNKWNFIESTWGSGYADATKQAHVRRFDPYYFFVPAEVFIYKHYPENKDYLFLKKPISLNDYEELPNYSLNFFINRFKCLSHFKLIIVPETNRFKIEFEAPNDVKMIGHLKINENKIENTVFIQRDLTTNNIVVEVAVQGNQESKLCLFGGKSGNKTYDGICDFIVRPNKTLQKAPFFCTSFSFPTDIFLIEPRENNLNINKEYRFQILVEGIEVVLVDSKNEWIYFEKDLSNDKLWFLNYTPKNKGDVSVYVKIFEDKSFSGAFKYTIN